MNKLIKSFALLGYLLLGLQAPNVQAGEQMVISQNHLSNRLRQQIQAKSNRPWQQVIIDVADTSRGELEQFTLEAMQRDHSLKHIIVLSVSPNPKVTEFKYDAKTNRVTTTDLTAEISQPISLLSMRELLKRLDHSNSKFYTGLVVEAHGHGNVMNAMLKEGPYVSARQFFEDIKQEGIKIDVLELYSCLMGSISTLHYAAQSRKVDYLLASPQVLRRSIESTPGLVHAVSNLSGMRAATPDRVMRMALESDQKFNMRVNQIIFKRQPQKKRPQKMPLTISSTIAYYLPELRVQLRNWLQALVSIEHAQIFLAKDLWHSDLPQELSDNRPRQDSSPSIKNTSGDFFDRELSFDNFVANLDQFIANAGEEIPQSDMEKWELFKEESLALQRNLNTAIKYGMCERNGKFYSTQREPDMRTWPKECLTPLSLTWTQVTNLQQEGQDLQPNNETGPTLAPMFILESDFSRDSNFSGIR